VTIQSLDVHLSLIYYHSVTDNERCDILGKGNSHFLLIKVSTLFISSNQCADIEPFIIIYSIISNLCIFYDKYNNRIQQVAIGNVNRIGGVTVMVSVLESRSRKI